LHQLSSCNLPAAAATMLRQDLGPVQLQINNTPVQAETRLLQHLLAQLKICHPAADSFKQKSGIKLQKLENSTDFQQKISS
jgi:hypothetical protein